MGHNLAHSMLTADVRKDANRRQKMKKSWIKALGSAAAAAAISMWLLPAAPAQAQEEMREFRIGTDYDYDANPFSENFGGPGFIMIQTYEALLSIGPDGQPDLENSLATGYEVSADGLEYTFTLRPDLKWSDGETLDSSDVVYSWNEYAPASILFSGYVSNLDKAEAIDRNTVKITLTQPDARVPSAFVYIIPEHIWADVPEDDLFTYDPCCNVVGSGPMVITRLEGKGTTILEPNPYYHGPAGEIDRFLIIKYGDKESQLRDLQIGAIDAMVEGESRWVNQLADAENIKVWSAPTPLVNAIAFNSCPPEGTEVCAGPAEGVAVEVVQDEAIRDALRWAIDKNNLLETAYGGVGSAANSWIPVYYEPFGIYKDLTNDPVAGSRFNPDRAREILAEGGWVCGPDGATCVKDGIDAEFTLSVRSEIGEDQNAAQRIVAWAADIGIKINIEVVTTDKIFEYMYAESTDEEGMMAPTYDAIIINELGDPTTADSLFALVGCSSFSSDTYHCDPELDTIAAAALAETDPARRVELLADADRRVFADGPYIPLVNQNLIVLTRKDTWTGYQPHVDQPYFVNPVQFQLISPGVTVEEERTSQLAIILGLGALLLVLIAFVMRRRKKNATTLELED